MASSSRSIYRFSTSIARAQGTERPNFRRQLQPYFETIAEREHNATTRAMNALTSENVAPVETAGRRRFAQHEFITPDELNRTSLYAADKPRVRPPLLGPKNREAKKIDPFHITRSSPLDHIYNPLMGIAFVNQMGRIRSRAETGLTWKSQRAMGKLVRRQRAMGIIGQWSGRPAIGGYGSSEK